MIIVSENESENNNFLAHTGTVIFCQGFIFFYSRDTLGAPPKCIFKSRNHI